MEYLGLWVTRNGIHPVHKKVEYIVNMTPPKTIKQLCAFVGLVNYYRYVLAKRSYLLQPLTSLTSIKVKFKWIDVEQKAFNKIIQKVARDTLLIYPYFNKRFYIHTDASYFQLGAVISKCGKPIAFYSRKLTELQLRYKVTEKELLSMVEILKKFRTILLGERLKIYTDHKILTCKKINTDRVLQWRLILEKYGPDMEYIPGKKNIATDTLSQLTNNGNQEATHDTTYTTETIL